jgi:hypothetical protein
MTTRVHREIDLERAARRLLDADLAVSAAWPSEEGIRLTPRLRPLDRDIRRLDRLVTDVERAETTRRSLLLWLKHPVIITKGLWSSWRQGELGEEVELGPGPRESLAEAAQVIEGAQVISSAERDLDSELFGGDSRDRDRFVRLLLRGSYHDIALPGIDGQTQHVVFEPRLLLHESGVVQLTVAVPYKVDLTTEQLVALSRSDTTQIVKSEMAEQLLAGLPGRERSWNGEWSADLDAGARLRVMEFSEPVTMAETLDRHLTAVGAIIGHDLPTEWLTYATTMTSAGGCCAVGDWEKRHGPDLARVVARFSTSAEVDHSALLGKNLSVSRDHSLYANMGSATYFRRRGVMPRGLRQLYTVLIIEYGLLLYWRLRSLEWDAEVFRLRARKLERLYRASIRLFAEMRHGEIRYGSAQAISRHLLRDLGGEDIRANLERTLDLSAQAYATKSAHREARRAFRLAFVATLVAIIVAIPAVPDFLKAVVSVPQDVRLDWALDPFRWVADQGPFGPWIIAFAVLIIGALLWLIPQLVRVRHVRIPRWLRRRGWKGPGDPIHVTFTEDDDDIVGPKRRRSKKSPTARETTKNP